MSDWVLFGSIAILTIAGFIHGLFGIGFAMISMPLLALFLDYRTAVLLAALPLLLMAASWLLVNRRQLCRCGLPPSLFPAIAIGAAIGTPLQTTLPERISVLLLATALAGSVLVSLSLEKADIARNRRPVRATAAFGALAGLTESALNVGAPFMLLYGALARLDRARQLIALNVCFVLGKTIQVGLMQLTALPQLTWVALGAGTAASMLAFHLGNAVASQFSQSHFRQGFRYLLVAIVGALVLRAFFL